MGKRYVTPAEVCENFLGIGEKKASLPMGKMLVMAMFAGAFIALAGVASTWCSMAVENVSIKRLIAGCVFPAGLAMVILSGAELFTGNCLMSIAWLEKRIKLSGVLRNWSVVYVGNLLGSVLIAAMVVWGGVFAGKEAILIDVAAGKVMPFGQALFRGVLCNILVCLAVLMAAAATDATGKIVGLFFPVAAFVVAGYEHCVANMYYFSAALLARDIPVVIGEVTMTMGEMWSKAPVTLGAVLGNMIPVTIGNIIGGAVLIGGGYWYIYRKGINQNG